MPPHLLHLHRRRVSPETHGNVYTHPLLSSAADPVGLTKNRCIPERKRKGNASIKDTIVGRPNTAFFKGQCLAIAQNMY